MKKTILPDSHKTQALVLVLALSLAMETASADFVFGTPTNLGPPVNSAYSERGPSISVDGLELYFFDYPNPRPGGYGDWDMWVTTRATKDDPWGEPINLGPTVNSSSREANPNISTDGLSLYFNSSRPGGYGGDDPYGGMDLWVTTRPTISDPWGTPANLGPTVNSSSYREASPSISADGRSLFYNSSRSGGSGGQDIWVTTRKTPDDDWGVPVNLGPIVNSPAQDYSPDISSDGLWLFFSSERPGGYSSQDIWVATRVTKDDPWGEPVNLGPPVNNSAGVNWPNISADGSTLFFEELSQVPLIPIVDFNGDYRVDIEDLLILIEHWGQNEPAFDMGPMPWGDGVVDAADLEVLMRYYGQEAYDPNLLAHWKLDETEGGVAYDSAGTHDGDIIGGPVWQADAGMIDGALQFDGIDDHIQTPLKLDPAKGEFSAFAWIKGAVAGQVIISQEDGADWLLTDTQGCLMTNLKSYGRRAGDPLISETIITDDDWRRVGFTWDGINRTLYVDDVEAAHDTLGGLKGSDGNLHIGTGKGLEVGTFWSGMIDDVRIYDRVVVP